MRFTQKRCHDVADGTHAAEVLGYQAVSRLALDVINKVNGVNAVNFEIFVQIGVHADALWLNFKKFDQGGAQQVVDLGFVQRGHGDSCCLCSIQAASVSTL